MSDNSDVMNISKEEVESLIEELSEASDSYYQKGEDSPLTDEEFDAKQSFLKKIYDSELFPELFEEDSAGFLLLEGDVALGSKVNGKDIVSHSVPMLSLGKAKVEKDLYSYLDKVREVSETSFKLQAKLDGLAISLKYSDGNLVQISTRGDGAVGEDVTYLLHDPDVTLVGAPRVLSSPRNIEVRGELFFTQEQFEKADEERFKKTSERFKNSRNSASGLLKKAKLGIGYPVSFTFSSYAVVENGSMTDLSVIKSLGDFLDVDSLTVSQVKGLSIKNLQSNEDVMEAVHKFGELRKDFTIPTDGVVIKPESEGALYQSMGSTSHHPNSQIAWKYPAETAQSTILKVDVTVGKSGRLTPIARITPVSLAGSTVSNASLHNFNLIREKNIRIGSIVLIEKANDIIPQVQIVLSNPADSVEITVPKTCPSCNTELIAKSSTDDEWPPKTLICPNVNCASRDFFALKTSVGKNFLDIDKLSEVTLAYLHKIGEVRDISDLYTLSEEVLANSVYGYSKQGNPRRLGEKIAKHILSYIEASKNRPLTKLLPALSINSLGPSTTKALLKALNNFENIRKASVEELSLIDGIGEVKAQEIHDGLIAKSDLIDRMIAHGVKFDSESSSSTDSEDSLSGLSFSISGNVPEPFSNRNEWVDFIESKGGEFHSAPKSGTNFIVADINGSSSKINKAKKLGIEFLSAADFTSRFVK